MKLAHFDFETVFDLNSNAVNVLVIESEEYFFRYYRELVSQINGEEGGFCLSDDDVILKLAKSAACVDHYLSLQISDKKHLSKLYAVLQQIAETSFLREYQRLSEAMADFFAKLNAESDSPLTYNVEGGIVGLLKAFDVRIEKESSLLEELIQWIRFHANFLHIKCFFFVNLKTMLSSSSISALYHEAALQDVCLFLLENTQRKKLDGEIVTILDRDLCEFLA